MPTLPLQGGGDHDELRETEAELFADVKDAAAAPGSDSPTAGVASVGEGVGAVNGVSPRGSAPGGSSLDLEAGGDSTGKSAVRKGGASGARGTGWRKDWAIFTQVRAGG